MSFSGIYWPSMLHTAGGMPAYIISAKLWCVKWDGMLSSVYLFCKTK